MNDGHIRFSIIIIAFRSQIGSRSNRYAENTQRLRKIQANIVNSAMTPYPLSVSPSCTMQEAAALMLRRNLNRVLITETDTDRLVGIISSNDIFRLAFEDGLSCAV